MPADPVFDSDVRPYIKFEGEVEIRWGWGQNQDLLKYMNEDPVFLEYQGEFDSEMCKKDTTTNTQTILWCHACKNDQKNLGTLITHIKGKKHINKVTEFRRLQQGFEKELPQQPKAKKAKTKLPTEPDARYSITELLQRYPTDPALGLEHVHEWSHPSDLEGSVGDFNVKWYTCDLKGCKSAWGRSFEMCAHLIGNKNKHNRNYLSNKGVHDANGLTLDKLLAKSHEIDQQERGFGLEKNRDYSVINRHYDLKQYTELATRPKEWSESKDKVKRLRVEQREQQYRLIIDIFKRAGEFSRCQEGGHLVEEATDKTLEFVKIGAESSLMSLDVAKSMTHKLQDRDQKESIKSKDAKLRPRLKKILILAQFKLDVNRNMRKALEPFYINPKNPEMVRIPSEAKFKQQACYLAHKVILAELKKKKNDLEELKVQSVVIRKIYEFVEDNMTRMPGYLPLEEL